MKTLKGGRVVMIASVDLVASNILWVGSQWVKPKVICRVFAKFSPRQLAKVRHAQREVFVRSQPILFTEL